MTEVHVVFGAFSKPGEKPRQIEAIKQGHINDTFRVLGDKGSHLILQRINHAIFKNPVQLMDNVVRVTRHLSQRLLSEGVMDLERRVLQVQFTNEGQAQHHEQDHIWRAYLYIDKTYALDSIERNEQARIAAYRFGNFSGLLADLPDPPLFETIPHFHDGPRRWQALQAAIAENPYGRASKAAQEIAFTQSHAADYKVLAELIAKGQLPLRVTHNDTKINNILFDSRTHEPLAVIDLDTVMPGSVLYDFGDLVRSSVGTCAEDEPDLSKLALRPGTYDALATGFKEGMGEAMTALEEDHLRFAARYMCLLIGTRFLTDYLLGDTYFRTSRDEHNLDRCRTQFGLAELLGD